MNQLSQPVNKFGNAGQWTGVVSTGLNLLGGLLGGGGGGGGACRAPQGCFQCRMTGQGDIAGCLDLLYSQWQQVEAQIGHVPNANIIQALTAIRDAVNSPLLDRPNYNYLRDARAQWPPAINARIAQLQSGGGGSTTTTTTGGSGGNVTGSSITIGGETFPTSYLIVGGAVSLMLLYVLTRK